MRYAIAYRTDYYGPRSEYKLAAVATNWIDANRIAAAHESKLRHPGTGLIELPHGAYAVDVLVMPISDDDRAIDCVELYDPEADEFLYARAPDNDESPTSLSDADKHQIADDVESGL